MHAAGLAAFVPCVLAVDIGILLLMHSMWRRRRELLVGARSPLLSMMQGFMVLVMINTYAVQECFRLAGVHFPCNIILWMSHTVPCMELVPLMLKAARVIIVTSEEYRSKYMFLLSPPVALGLSVATTLVMCSGALALQLTESDAMRHADRYCISMRPWWLWIGVMLGSTATIVILIRRLYAIRDSLGLGAEISRCLVAFYVLGLPYLALVVLSEYGTVEIDSRVHSLLVAAALYMMAERS
eukprot:TRINITY_DN4192_c0_g3_i1.p1 TRINITY_DN4192_c0_g3~~TRINITY_DN4192_c0_g3_i1.p1  ORF type:complete len:241 (-),score=31.14 TRINITY_DN4192_c0_g3_i1:692-1414(-)